jgi:hypothetical protein
MQRRSARRPAILALPGALGAGDKVSRCRIIGCAYCEAARIRRRFPSAGGPVAGTCGVGYGTAAQFAETGRKVGVFTGDVGISS